MKNELRYLALDEVECRNNEGLMTISGYAIRYNKPSGLLYGEFVEYIDTRALDGVELDNTFLLYNHNSDHVLGNTKSGTLKLENRADGLYFDANLPNTQQAKETYELIKRGDINGMSFGFTVEKDSWKPNAHPPERTIRQLGTLNEISVVPYPAYESTTVATRALDFLKECRECKNDVIKKDIKEGIQMKTIGELKELRAAKHAEMTEVMETRADTMDTDALAAINSIKAEIKLLDGQVEAIEEIRKLAVSGSSVRTDDKEAKEETRANFLSYLRGNLDASQMKKYEERIMTSGGATSGAELVPDEFYRVLEEAILEFSDFKQDAFNFTTGDNGTLTMPAIDDTANTGAWVSEGGSIPVSDASTSERTMAVYKVGSGIVVSTELIEDDAFDLVSWVARAIGTRLARTYNAAFILGDGAGKPLGIIPDPTTITVPTATIGVTAIKDALNLRYALQTSSRVGGIYYASDAMMKDMESWEDENGRPLLQASGVATQANGIMFSLWGYPVKLNTNLGDPNTPSDVPLIFGNPMKYMIRNVRGITLKRDDYEFMSTDEVSFYGTTRLDGKLTDVNDAFTKLVVKAA